LLNASVVTVMREAGKALNDTFKLHNAGVAEGVSGQCVVGFVVLNVTEQVQSD